MMAKIRSPLDPRLENRLVLKIYLRALGALIPLLIVYWVIQPQLISEDSLLFLNGFLPIYFIIVMIFVAWRVTLIMPAGIWTALVWFPVNSAIFFGFGPLVQIYGNESARVYISRHFLGISDSQLFQAYQLSVTGIALVFLGLISHMNFQRRSWAPPMRHQTRVQEFSLVRLGIVFAVFGAILRYFIMKPAEWSMIGIVVPGVVSGLGYLIDLGLAILAYCAGRGNRFVRPILLLALPLHLFLIMLSFAKVEMVLALFLPALSYYLASSQFIKLIRHLVLIALVYATLQPIVHYGRGVIFERTETISQASYGERIEILVEFVFASRDEITATDRDDDFQGWWTRLNYAGPQVRAMELHDSGFGGSSLQQMWIFFIPRAVWPDKPIIVGPGRDFYRLLTGREHASTFLGLSIYGDLYLQFGWSGLFIGCFLFGWLLGITGALSLMAMRSKNFIMLPFVLMALSLALDSPNKYVLNGVIGPLPIMIGYYVGLSYFRRIFGRRQQVVGSANSDSLYRP